MFKTDEILKQNKKLIATNNLLTKITGDILKTYEDHEKLQEVNKKQADKIKSLQEEIVDIKKKHQATMQALSKKNVKLSQEYQALNRNYKSEQDKNTKLVGDNTKLTEEIKKLGEKIDKFRSLT